MSDPSTTCLDEALAFDEDWYLATYTDVNMAVRAGDFARGQDHYTRHGRAEGRFACAAAQQQRRGGGIDAAIEPQLSEAERREQVGAFWSVKQTPGWYWMAHPMVRARLNAMASDDPAIDAYEYFAGLLQRRGVALPLRHAVSLGCGFGNLERDLARRGIISEIDAYDVAPGAIAEARRLARENGFDGLRYHVADLETEPLGSRMADVVFAHQSVHHVKSLDALFVTVADALVPGGLFHLHEFVGPDRFQWTDAQMSAVNRLLGSLEPRHRRLPSGSPKPAQARPTVAAMIAADPSEAIRSSEIIPALRRHFDILENRALGGAILHLGLADIAQNFDPDLAEDRALMEEFFAVEDDAMRDGRVDSDFRVIIAVKR